MRVNESERFGCDSKISSAVNLYARPSDITIKDWMGKDLSRFYLQFFEDNSDFSTPLFR